MRDFRSLKVWEKSHAFALAVYRACESFPRTEQYGLTSQLQRAALSIPTNIAEGCGYDSDAQFVRFLDMALGSASECEYLLLFARELGYVDPATYTALHAAVVEIKRMLTGLLKTLRRREPLVADT